MRVVGYIRVSTAEQATSGLGLAAQREALDREAQRRGWELVAVEEDHASGKTMRNRPGLAEALRKVAAGEADTLMVSKLDRLARSVSDFARLMDEFREAGWGLIVLDLGVDTTSIMGEAMANVVAAFAQAERRRIGERTREAMAQAKANGRRLGRPPVLGDDVRGRIRAMREAGQTFRAIADTLSSENIPTAHGGSWHPNTIRRIVAAS